MRKKVLTGLSGLVVVILFTALLLAGCGGGSSGFNSLTSLAKMAPQDSETIFFIDVKNFKSDTELGELYNEMKDSFNDEIAAASSERDIISFEDIHYLGLVIVNGQEIVWVNGDLNLEAIRDALEEDDYEKDTYQGVEIWYGYDDAVAIHNGTLILGDETIVEESVEAIVDPENSAYENNEDIRDVVRETPSGLFSILTLDQFFFGSRGMGMSFSKSSADLMKFEGCFVFDDNDYAEDAVSGIESDMESGGLYQIEARRSGNVVKFAAEIDMEDTSLFW